MQRIRFLILIAVLGVFPGCTAGHDLTKTTSPQVLFSSTSLPSPGGNSQEATTISTSTTENGTTITSTAEPSIRELTVTVESIMPANIDLAGTIVGLDRQKGGYVLLALPQFITYSLPGNRPALGKFPLFAVSPDRSKLAYIDTTSGGNKELRIVLYDGTEQDVLDQSGDYWWFVIEWLDDQRLALAEIDHRDGTTYIFDLASGELLELVPFFPEVTSKGALLPVDIMPVPYVYYDPSLTRLIVVRYLETKPPQTNYELWDVEARTLLWESSGYFGSDERPVWSPDKSSFILGFANYTPPNETLDTCEQLFLNDLNGEQLLLHDCIWGMSSWSPDGKFIASWLGGDLKTNPKCNAEAALLVLEIGTGNMETYSICLGRLEGGISTRQYPIWSPDGRFIAFNVYNARTVPEGVVILNLDLAEAFVLPNIEEVLGWMHSAP